jgi:hypothetical protein
VSTVVVGPNPEHTRLELSGIERHCLPVRVTRESVDTIVDECSDTTFLGRYHWQEAVADVPSQERPCRLLAFGRTWTFVSAAPIDVRGPRVTVPMLPGSRVHIEWVGWRPDRDRDAIVEVETAHGNVARMLAPSLVARHGAHWPALVGDLVVPQGRWVARCWRADGSQAWVEAVAADRHWLPVQIAQ